MKAFRRIQTSDLDLMKVQNAVEQSLNPLIKLPILDGTLLKDVDLTTNALKVSHNLSRQPVGWFLVDQNTNSVVYKPDWSTTTITLQASVACTVSVWVF